jgi:hypothetical protein
MRLLSTLRLSLAILAILPPVPSAVADGFQIPLRSTLVRVTRSDGGRPPAVGTPVGVREDTLMVVNGSARSGIPLRGIERLEVSRGTSRATGRGALIGLVAGGGIGAVIGATSEHDAFFSQGFNIAAGAFSFGLLGAGVGAVAGHASKRVRWEALPVRDVGVDSAGQLWAPIGVSQRVRVTAPLWERGRVTGTVLSLGDDSLVLVRGDRARAIPTRLVRKVETSWSRRSNGTLGALIGFAAGFATGVIGTGPDPNTPRATGGLTVGLFLGLPAGWLIGMQVKSARWEEIPLRPPPLTPLDRSREFPEGGIDPGGR